MNDDSDINLVDIKIIKAENYKEDIESKNGIVGIHYNIRSIRKNYDQLYATIIGDNIHVDFIALTECWANEQEVKNDNLSLPGYKLYIGKNKFNKNGGTAIYIRDKNSVIDMNLEHENYECDILGKTINIPELDTMFI